MAMSVLVVGAGGHAKVVLATLYDLGIDVEGVLDDARVSAIGEILGVPIIGPISLLSEQPARAVLAIGSNAVRQRLAASLVEVEWLTLVHPRAVVHESVTLGSGTVVFAGAVLQPDTVVGRHVIVNTGATIDHDGRIVDFAHVAPGAHLSGGVTVGEGGFLGVGACAVPDITIGAWGIVGAAAAVVQDLPSNVTAVGVPAMPIKERPGGWHL